MKYIWEIGCLFMLAGFILPISSSASVIKTINGTVTSIDGSQVNLSTVSAAKYSVELGAAQLTRKNGSVIKFSEILVGDKVQATGTLWDDNSMNATTLKDNSLYAHNSTFTGKITTINPVDSSFTMQSKDNGDQSIYTNNFTAFTKNGSSSGFNNLELGMTATVKGMWDRNKNNILASNIEGSFRLIAIEFTGYLSMRSDTALTVVGNGNVIYGVDITKATILNSKSKAVPIGAFKLGDNIRVWGKHISGMVAVTASKVKDTSLTK